MRTIATTGLALILIGSQAIAQTAPPLAGDDWDMTRDAREKRIIAHLGLSTGLVIATRCWDDRFDVVLAGLPPAPGRGATRPLTLGWDGEPPDTETWNVTTDRAVALASFPSATARRLREGGRLRVTIPDGAGPGRNLVHDVELPASSAAIGETLSACGKPLVDPRDALLPDVPESGLSASAVWTTAPRPRFPEGSRYASGYAVVTCLTQPDGRLDDCVIESEHPGDGRFGESTLDSTRRARIDIPGETRGSFPRRMVAFRTTYMLQ